MVIIIFLPIENVFSLVPYIFRLLYSEAIILKATGIPVSVSITVGTILIGRTGKTLRCTYTDEILEEISDEGSILDVGGKLVSISAVPVSENPIAGIANMFWVSYIPVKKICVGG